MNIVFDTTFEFKNIVLPLGISFFTFQQIAYLVDSYKGETEGYTFDEYALFISFFPQLVAGPIVSHNEIIPQFRKHENQHIILRNFSKGIYVFAIGLFKKLVLADTFGMAVTYGFGTIETLSSMEAFIVSLSYTFQLYFDFSGYCDMATGIAFMFNIELPVNFNSPYKATSILEFWKRWHISLTKFLRTYIYFPLGGNRGGRFRTYLNIMIVFGISGVWHGANYTFILWGILHGLINCLNRLFIKPWKKLNIITQWVLTFTSVNLLWVLFRAESISSATLFFKKMFRLSDFSICGDLYKSFDLIELAIIEEKVSFLQYLTSNIAGFHMWVFLLGAFFIVLNLPNSKEIKFEPTVSRSLITIIFLVWSVMSFSGMSTFLYFNF